MDRTQKLLSIRPLIASAKIMPEMSDAERFQNQTLRPIIKLQNDLFIAVFKNHIHKRKGVFYQLTLPKKVVYIEHALLKDTKLRNVLKGIIIGHKGAALKRVGAEARKDLEKFFGKQIYLELYAKVNKNWRSNERQLKRFGYNN